MTITFKARGEGYKANTVAVYQLQSLKSTYVHLLYYMEIAQTSSTLSNVRSRSRSWHYFEGFPDLP